MLAAIGLIGWGLFNWKLSTFVVLIALSVILEGD